MPVCVTVRDETSTGQVVNELSLELLTERVTVRELIRSRVYQEVQDHNLRAAAKPFRGLVQPAETEVALNPAPRSTPRPIDWRRQFEVATQAYERRGFLILVDDQQAGGLDDEITLRAGSQVSFLRLVPLVGG